MTASLRTPLILADEDKPKDKLIYVGQDETKNGRVALWYAASEGHNAVTLIRN